jgi:hypothetical protein
MTRGAATVSGADAGVVARCAVAATLAGAAIIHATVVGEHLEEWAPAGLFFLGLVLVEGSLGSLALLAWSRLVCVLVAVSGLGTVAVWTVSRTTGMPIGPADFRVPEAVGRADVVCGILELVAAAVCVLFLSRPRSSTGSTWADHGVLAVLPVVAIVASVALVTALGVAPALSTGGGQHGHAAHAPVLPGS